MGEKLAGTGWLIVGGVAALATWSGIADPALFRLDAFLGGGWRRAAVGALVFAAGCALYFRAHWAATLASLAEQSGGRARGLRETAADLERSAHVIGDNLLEVERHVADRSGRLYLDGAKAHAAKLSQMAQRLRGAGSGDDRDEPRA